MKRLGIKIALSLTVLGIGIWLFRIGQNKDRFSGSGDVFFYTLFLFEDATRFSSGFSEAKFQLVHQGQSKDEVQLILGKPLLKDIDTRTQQEYWRYTKAPPDRNYWFRVVVFGHDGQVKEVDRHYYVD